MQCVLMINVYITSGVCASVRRSARLLCEYSLLFCLSVPPVRLSIPLTV